MWPKENKVLQFINPKFEVFAAFSLSYSFFLKIVVFRYIGELRIFTDMFRAMMSVNI